MSDNASATTFRVGDRVKITDAAPEINGYVGLITDIDDTDDEILPIIVSAGRRGAGLYVAAHEITPAPRMSAPARALLAAWHASDRTLERIDRPDSSNRANINWGRAVRRYCTPDRSIDLTIAVEVK